MRHESEKQNLSSIFRSCNLCSLNNVNQSHPSLLTRHMTIWLVYIIEALPLYFEKRGSSVYNQQGISGMISKKNYS